MEVLVIGAGPAGLTAAYELLKKSDYAVTVVEEQGLVGGISATVEYKGNRMDLGGHRFFTKNAEVKSIWFELLKQQRGAAADGQIPRVIGVQNAGDPETEDAVMLERRRVSRIYYNGKFFDYPIKLSAKLFKTLGLKDTMACGFSYLKSVVHKLPETSLENFYINRFGKKLYSMFFESYTEKLWGIHPSKLDASWGEQRVKGLSVMSVLKNAVGKGTKEVSLIESFYYPKYGPGQMWEIMCNKIEGMGGKVLMNTKMKRIVREGSKYEVTCVQGGVDTTKTYDIVISSTGVRELVGAMQGVPMEVYKASQGLHYRDFQTIGLLAKKMKLKNTTGLKTMNDIVPDCWIYVQDKGVQVGRLQIFNNWSPYLVKDKDTCWLSMEYFCTEGDKQWCMTDEEFKALAVEEIVKLGVLDAADIIDTKRVKVRKAYPVYDEAYQSFGVVRDWLKAQDNLYCVGRNGQHKYNNLDHSMLTACETVRAVLGRTPAGRVWEVNTESVYHESK